MTRVDSASDPTVVPASESITEPPGYAHRASPPALSLRRWPASPPAVDPTGRRFLLLAIGAEAADIAAHWQGAVADIFGVDWDGQVAVELHDRIADIAQLRGIVHGCMVGTRLMAAGGDSDLLAIEALAIEAGFLEQEWRFCLTVAEQIRIYCVHCTTTFTTAASPGQLSTCPECERELRVQSHVSGRLASYLGVDSHVREPRQQESEADLP